MNIFQRLNPFKSNPRQLAQSINDRLDGQDLVDTTTGKTVSAEEISEIVAELVAMYEDASSSDDA